MTGEQLVQLMQDPDLCECIHRIARRFSKCIEDQEEYIDDAWLRIAEKPQDKTQEYYEHEAFRAIDAAYHRKRYANVEKKNPENLNGISENRVKKLPKDAIHLHGNKYLNPTPEKLSHWYYDKEWEEYGIEKDGYQVRTFYEIIVTT